MAAGAILAKVLQAVSATFGSASASSTTTKCAVSKGPFSSADDAARAALKYANPRSIKDNLEYGGLIYKDASGKYYYSGPVQGGDQGVSPQKAAAPPGTTVVADYHTHADYSLQDPKTLKAIRTSDPKRDDFDSDNFSDPDKKSAKALGYPAYLATPGGKSRCYDPAKNTDRVL